MLICFATKNIHPVWTTHKQQHRDLLHTQKKNVSWWKPAWEHSDSMSLILIGGNVITGKVIKHTLFRHTSLDARNCWNCNPGLFECLYCCCCFQALCLTWAKLKQCFLIIWSSITLLVVDIRERDAGNIWFMYHLDLASTDVNMTSWVCLTLAICC